MRIVFLLTTSLDRPLGFGRVWPIAKEMVKRGYKPSIVALHHNFTPDVQRYFEKDGVGIYYAGQMHVRKTDKHEVHFSLPQLLWVTIWGTARMIWLAWRLNPDAIHIFKPHPMNGLAGLIVSWLRRKPLYLDCDDYEAGANRFNGRWQQEIIRIFEDGLPRLATACTTNTQFMMQRLQKLGVLQEHIYYVPNGVDRARVVNLESGRAEILRKELGLTGKQVILYLGSIRLSTHAVDILLASFAQLCYNRNDLNTVLILLGGGGDRDKLKEMAASFEIEDKILFLESVAPSETSYYLELADVTVDPVRNSDAVRGRSPLKIVESLACGTPVITGDVGDRRHILGDGRYGMLVEPDSIPALTEALQEFLFNPELAQTMREHILEDRENLNLYWDQLVDTFVQVYQHR